MTARTPADRSSKLTIAVSGAGSGTGAAVLAALGGEDLRKLIAIDERRGDTALATWRVADVRDPAFAAKLSGVDVLVHLAQEARLDAPAAQRRALNVRGTSVALTAAAASGVKRVVIVTSAMVYGARDDNPVPLDESAGLRANPDDSLIGDWVEIERSIRRSERSHPWLQIVTLRPATVVGPGIDSVITRHFESPRLLVLKGSTPLWQFCHIDDLVRAVVVAATGDLVGAVNVASDGWLTQADVERISGKRHMELPPAVAFGTLERLHRVGATPATSQELEFLAYPWVVGTARLRAAGWAPQFGNEAALEALLTEARRHLAVGARRLDRKDATRAAAGATVALVATAALARRARKRRRG
ncbi:MAG: Nucleoside-diphosphate-sugar epimerase-like protein [Frankiales bacterium]|nr:Nucleoside-diphosphate-sugar epimerase-like protein [Frankiales bacterium]